MLTNNYRLPITLWCNLAKSYKGLKRTIRHQNMVVYKHQQTVTGRAIASTFRGHYISNFIEKRKRKFFPHRDLNRYPVRSKAHTLPLSHPGLVGQEWKRNIAIHNILRARKDATWHFRSLMSFSLLLQPSLNSLRVGFMKNSWTELLSLEDYGSKRHLHLLSELRPNLMWCHFNLKLNVLQSSGLQKVPKKRKTAGVLSLVPETSWKPSLVECGLHDLSWK